MRQTVLVVDDSFLVRQQVGRALKGADFEVVEATDGLDAIEKLEHSEGIGLVFCDVNMPRMNGLEFLESLRANSAHARVRVVMLTTEGHPELVQRAKALGSSGWIVKPFKPEFLVATAKKLTQTAPGK